MSSWWLEHYSGFAHHLEAHYATIASTESVQVFDLKRKTDCEPQESEAS
jgi:hypothetical protein